MRGERRFYLVFLPFITSRVVIVVEGSGIRNLHFFMSFNNSNSGRNSLINVMNFIEKTGTKNDLIVDPSLQNKDGLLDLLGPICNG